MLNKGIQAQIYEDRELLESNEDEAAIQEEEDRLGPDFHDHADAYRHLLNNMAKNIKNHYQLKRKGFTETVLESFPTKREKAGISISALFGFAGAGFYILPNIAAAGLYASQFATIASLLASITPGSNPTVVYETSKKVMDIILGILFVGTGVTENAALNTLAAKEMWDAFFGEATPIENYLKYGPNTDWKAILKYNVSNVFDLVNTAGSTIPNIAIQIGAGANPGLAVFLAVLQTPSTFLGMRGINWQAMPGRNALRSVVEKARRVEINYFDQIMKAFLELPADEMLARIDAFKKAPNEHRKYFELLSIPISKEKNVDLANVFGHKEVPLEV